MQPIIFLVRVSAHSLTVGKTVCECYAVEVSRDGKTFEAVTFHKTEEAARAQLAKLCENETKTFPHVLCYPTDEFEEKELDWTAFFKNQNNE